MVGMYMLVLLVYFKYTYSILVGRTGTWFQYEHSNLTAYAQHDSEVPKGYKAQV